MKKCLLQLKADLEPATDLIRGYVLAGTRKPVPGTDTANLPYFPQKSKR